MGSSQEISLCKGDGGLLQNWDYVLAIEIDNEHKRAGSLQNSLQKPIRPDSGGSRVDELIAKSRHKDICLKLSDREERSVSS